MSNLTIIEQSEDPIEAFQLFLTNAVDAMLLKYGAAITYSGEFILPENSPGLFVEVAHALKNNGISRLDVNLSKAYIKGDARLGFEFVLNNNFDGIGSIVCKINSGGWLQMVVTGTDLHQVSLHTNLLKLEDFEPFTSTTIQQTVFYNPPIEGAAFLTKTYKFFDQKVVGREKCLTPLTVEFSNNMATVTGEYSEIADDFSAVLDLESVAVKNASVIEPDSSEQAHGVLKIFSTGKPNIPALYLAKKKGGIVLKTGIMASSEMFCFSASEDITKLPFFGNSSNVAALLHQNRR